MFSLGCSIHDAHNSLKWAMGMTCDVEVCCRSLHSLLQSLRKSLPYIHENLGSWLAVSVEFREAPRDAEVAQAFWSSLGVAVDWLPLAVELDVHFFEDKVWINPQWRSNKDALETLHAFYLHCFRFRAATESRWLSIGVACRCVVLAIPLGLPALLDWLLEQPKAPEDDLQGWSKFFVSEVPLFVVVCAFASRVADSAIARLMEDDRILQIHAELKEAVELEVALIQEMPAAVWEWVAGDVMTDGGAAVLRSTCILASMISLGYFSFKVFRVVNSLPWRLALGDVAENLSQIDLLDPEQDDPVCNKIRNLLEQGPRPPVTHPRPPPNLAHKL